MANSIFEKEDDEEEDDENDGKLKKVVIRLLFLIHHEGTEDPDDNFELPGEMQSELIQRFAVHEDSVYTSVVTRVVE
ncbi:hypothetical protein BD408DRAFT_435648 [Parasitella parasitica]|nr:hypothetical protein BD408DRAFT_435648 [Parasitella parasitica]